MTEAPLPLRRCPFCEYRGTYRSLTLHVHHGHIANGKCPICGKHYNSLKRHIISHAHRGETKYQALVGLMGMKERNAKNADTRRRFLRDCRAVAMVEVKLVGATA